MKIEAIAVYETGGPEVLRLEHRELADPGPGQVRIRTRAAGVNYIDVYFRTGLYARPLPFVAGLEGAGEVESIGAGVSDLAVGDRVAWSSVPGSYPRLPRTKALTTEPASLSPCMRGSPHD